MIEPWMIFLAIAVLWMFIGLAVCLGMDWRDAPDDTLQLVATEMEAIEPCPTGRKS